MRRNDKETGNSLERRLAELDFSDQSLIRDSLGRELTEKSGLRPGVTGRTSHGNRRWKMFRKPIPAFSLGIFVALAVVALAHPDTQAALSKFLKIFQVGDSTYVYQHGTMGQAAIDSILATSDQNLEKGESYFLHNVYGGFGGNVPRGADPFIKQTASLSLAAGLVDFPLQVQTYFNDKIPARLRFQKAEVLPNGSAILYFGIGPFETMLMQTPVGEGKTMGFGSTKSTTTADGVKSVIGIAPNMEEIEIDGHIATWMIHDEGTRRRLGKWAAKETDTIIGRFIWEKDGVSYILDGRLLTKEEGIKIIESLRSARLEK